MAIANRLPSMSSGVAWRAVSTAAAGINTYLTVVAQRLTQHSDENLGFATDRR